MSERERRRWWATELPFVVGALAAVAWVPPLRPVDPLVCVLLVGAYAVADHVRIPLPRGATASAVQLALVPILFLAPLHLVALMVLAGNLIVDVIYFERDRRPLQRAVLSLGNSSYVFGPVLVLATAGHDAFGWQHWPTYVLALAAQIAGDALIAHARVRVAVGARISLRESPGLPAVIDAVLSVPALAVVAVAADAPVAAALLLAAQLAIANGFSNERRGRLSERAHGAEKARGAVLEERVRIARELHDVVAHHVSMIGIQAGAARVVIGRDPEKAKQALAVIESSSREAVLELHGLLGFLRHAGDPEDAGPQPGLAQLASMVAAVNGSQLVVEVHIEGQPRELAPTVDASAFRIVQEALTNTLKHARASRADVHLRYGRDQLEIAIVDDGRGTAAPASPPGGMGLIGMRERAALHDGQLTTGRGVDGGFSVHVTLRTNTGAP